MTQHVKVAPLHEQKTKAYTYNIFRYV